ncbi:MAG: N-acyl homoserine lactonase family protein [Rhizobiaceae bacterium]|nr:N-acyl homoserine lactonase family protein [Rhizobiaceae bacterium]
MMRVTAIETGKARMKTAQRTGRPDRGALGRKIDIFADRDWVEPLPILCFLVEHPEGRFLIDTGDTWRNSVAGYLPGWNPFYKQVSIRVAPEEEVGPRLRNMGMDPARDIAAVILTHFHHDHTGGLDHFPHTRILGPRENYAVSTGIRGKMMGCLPHRWPVWFKPELFDFDGPPIGPFARSKPVTSDGRVAIVPTPGHATGHASVIVQGEDVTYFIAGDATYSETNLRALQTDGVTNDPALARDTLANICDFAKSRPTVVLPAHDPESVRRLNENLVF